MHRFGISISFAIAIIFAAVGVTQGTIAGETGKAAMILLPALAIALTKSKPTGYRSLFAVDRA